MRFDARGQLVTCKECGSNYRCTPATDYYNATTDSDGVCEPCLVGDLPLHVVNACQAGRTMLGPPDSIWATPCMVPGAHQILLTGRSGMPERVSWFCDEHFGWLRARTPMRLLSS